MNKFNFEMLFQRNLLINKFHNRFGWYSPRPNWDHNRILSIKKRANYNNLRFNVVEKACISRNIQLICYCQSFSMESTFFFVVCYLRWKVMAPSKNVLKHFRIWKWSLATVFETRLINGKVDLSIYSMKGSSSIELTNMFFIGNTKKKWILNA